MKVKFNWTNKGGNFFSVGGYVPDTINPEVWKGYISSTSGFFLGHDALAHRANETGKTWQEARAIGATMFLIGEGYKHIPLQVVRESEKEGTWIAPPPFEENEITAKARENFADMNLEHLEEWVGWIAEGYRYASEESPYKPEHYKLLGSIKFGDLHKKHPHRSVTVDLITGKYRLGKAPQPVVNREYDSWQELKIFMRENA